MSTQIEKEPLGIISLNLPQEQIDYLDRKALEWDRSRSKTASMVIRRAQAAEAAEFEATGRKSGKISKSAK